MAWGKWIVSDNNYHYGEYGHPTYKTKDGGKFLPIYNVTHSCGCHFCNTNKSRKVNKANKLGYKGENWEKSWVCNTFVTAMYAHGGLDPTCLSRCQKSGAAGMDNKGHSPTLDKSKNWTSLGKIPIKDLKAGDVLVSEKHMQCVFAPVSNNKVKIIESTSYVGTYHSAASDKSIRISEKTPSYLNVYRFTGSVDMDISIRYGECGARVGLWQAYLNSAGFSCGPSDCKFGDNTLKATKAFQSAKGLTADGIVGKKTLAAAGDNVPADDKIQAKCIDVSYWQGKISTENWLKVKKTCGYAICRASYTSQSSFSLSRDSTFADNFTNAKAAGLKVGAYHYSQAITVEEAKAEAEYLCNILKNFTPTFYVVCDFEFGGRLNSKIGTKASDIANAFCDVVAAHGYKACIYANTATLTNYLKNPRYPVWCAQYNDRCTYTKPIIMWQYTSSGSVEGISGRVDLSHVYL